mgnify:CR=1 FL=1
MEMSYHQLSGRQSHDNLFDEEKKREEMTHVAKGEEIIRK